MTKVPSLNYNHVIRALRRDGWVVVRQKGSHIRLQKTLPDKTLDIISYFETSEYNCRKISGFAITADNLLKTE